MQKEKFKKLEWNFKNKSIESKILEKLELAFQSAKQELLFNILLKKMNLVDLKIKNKFNGEENFKLFQLYQSLTKLRIIPKINAYNDNTKENGETVQKYRYYTLNSRKVLDFKAKPHPITFWKTLNTFLSEPKPKKIMKKNI